MKRIKEEKISENLGKRNYNFKGIDAMGEFWVVTKPSDTSEMEDILFKADIFDFSLQLRGGLKGSEIVLITMDETEARETAENLFNVDPRLNVRR